MLVFLQSFTRAVDHLQPIADLLFDLTGHISIRHLDTVDFGLVLEQLLNGDLLRDDTIGVATPFDTFHGGLDTHGLHVGFQNGIVTHHPDNLVDDGADLYRICVTWCHRRCS